MNMYGRGRGTPNHNDRRVKEYNNRNTPQGPNRQFGGKPDNSARSNKKDDVPKVDSKQSPKPARKDGRSRSPVNRTAPKEDAATTVINLDLEEPAPTPEVAENKEEKRLKYAGRPGEKKFNGRCRLFVANLGNQTSEDELKELFGEFGETGEVYVNREKGFGFIRMDFRHNAEIAKMTLDKKLLNGRNISVRYATHASAVELHGLDNFASNDFIKGAMSNFGAVERCVVVCDDRGRSKGYAIVEFEWKRSAGKVLDRLKDEMFVLGRLPKPVFAKPFIMQDEEEGINEESLERMEGLDREREFQPRFVSPNSFEYVWAKRWRDLFIEEQDKKAKLEQEMADARVKLEFEIEAAIRQQDASRIREELARRQEELRMLEEDMMRRQEADMQILERSRQREMAARQGLPEPRDDYNDIQLSRENAARQQDFQYLRQKAEMTLQHNSLENIGLGRPDMHGPSGYGGHGQNSGGYHGGYQGQYGGGGPRQMNPGGMDNRMQQQQQQQQQRGPQRDQHGMQQHDMRDMQRKDMPPRDMPQDGSPKKVSDAADQPSSNPVEVDSPKRPRR